MSAKIIDGKQVAAEMRAELKEKVAKIESFLGPKLDFRGDKYPLNYEDRLIFEYLHELKHEYLRRKTISKKLKNKT